MSSLSPQTQIAVTRVAEGEWQAVQDEQVVGRGESWQPFDGRVYLSIDTWDDAARLALRKPCT